MARISNIERLSRKLQHYLTSALTDADLSAIATDVLINRLILLLKAKDNSTLPEYLLDEILSRDLVDTTSPEFRLQSLTDLITKTKLKEDDELSLSELEHIQSDGKTTQLPSNNHNYQDVF